MVQFPACHAWWHRRVWVRTIWWESMCFFHTQAFDQSSWESHFQTDFWHPRLYGLCRWCKEANYAKHMVSAPHVRSFPQRANCRYAPIIWYFHVFPQTVATIGHGFLLKFKVAITLWYFNPERWIWCNSCRPYFQDFSSMSRVYCANSFFLFLLPHCFRWESLWVKKWPRNHRIITVMLGIWKRHWIMMNHVIGIERFLFDPVAAPVLDLVMCRSLWGLMLDLMIVSFLLLQSNSEWVMVLRVLHFPGPSKMVCWNIPHFEINVFPNYQAPLELFVDFPASHVSWLVGLSWRSPGIPPSMSFM